MVILYTGKDNKDIEPLRKQYLNYLPMINKTLNFGSPRETPNKSGRLTRPQFISEDVKARPNQKRQELRHRRTLNTDF